MQTASVSPLHSHKTVEHLTPPSIIARIRYALGGIALDPASCSLANRLVRADRIFTEEQNGLSRGWWGPMYLNPPGKSSSNPKGAAIWWVKLVKEFIAASGGENPWSAIFLGFSLEILQTTQSYDVLHPLDFTMCIPKRRIKFLEADGDGFKEGSSPTHGNFISLLSFDEDVKRRFVDAFSEIGVIR